MYEALTQGEALLDQNAIRRRMSSMMSSSGGFLNARQARTAATLELLSDGTDVNKQQALCTIGAVVGKNQVTLGNYSRYAGSLDRPASPDSIGAVDFGHGEFAGYKKAAVNNEVLSTVPNVNVKERSDKDASDVMNESSLPTRAAHNSANGLRKRTNF